MSYKTKYTEKYKKIEAYYNSIAGKFTTYQRKKIKIPNNHILYKNGKYTYTFYFNTDIVGNIYLSENPSLIYLYTSKFDTSEPNPLYYYSNIVNKVGNKIKDKTNIFCILSCTEELEPVIESFYPVQSIGNIIRNYMKPIYKINLWKFPILKKLLTNDLLLTMSFDNKPDNLEMTLYYIQNCSNNILNKDFIYTFPFFRNNNPAIIEYYNGGHKIIAI